MVEGTGRIRGGAGKRDEKTQVAVWEREMAEIIGHTPFRLHRGTLVR